MDRVEGQNEEVVSRRMNERRTWMDGRDSKEKSSGSVRSEEEETVSAPIVFQTVKNINL